MKRRMFLGLAGGALCSCKEKTGEQFWNGIVFGIPVGIRFRNVTAECAESLGEKSRKLAQEYEASFSLWDENSELSRLNREGVLSAPSEALLDCLKIAQDFHARCGGVFDPSVHSYLEWAKGEFAAGRHLKESQIEKRRRLVDFSKVEISEGEIRLAEGMTLSLNAIAQGYVTDRICEFLEGRVLSALVNFGEYRVVGPKPFEVEIDGAEMALNLKRALAVSSGGGQRLSATVSANHLIRPKDGSSPDPNEVIVVEADTAVAADAIATIVALGGQVPEGTGEVKTWRL